MDLGKPLTLMTSSRFRFEPTQSNFNRSRFNVIKFSFIGFFLLLTGRLVFVQAVLRTDLQRRAQKQLPSITEDQVMRNKILDRNGLILAETVRVDSCYVDPKMIKNISQVSRDLSQILHLNPQSLKKEISDTKGSFMWVMRNVPSDSVQKIKDLKMEGVGFKKEWRRNYPSGFIASHLLGLVGVEGQGLSGVEHQFDSQLDLNKTAPENGYPSGHLQLTIDSNIQQIVEKELDWGMAQTKAKRGFVLIQEPHTGEILAMASFPRLNLNPDNPPHPKELRIPEIVDVFEPGSTFKVVTAAAAIEENVVSLKEKFSGEKGEWKVKNITIHDHEPLASMTFQDIITHSSNIGTAKIAERLGKEKLYQYARLFGFGVFPGSGLPGESKGMLRALSKWSGVSTYVVSFGQEVGVTALQLTGAYSAIANGGELMEPKFVKAILSDSQEVKWKSSPSVVRKVFSPLTAKTLTTMLMSVVEQGTGQKAQISWLKDFKVAGKTGTAQKFDLKTKTYNQDLSLVSFCGFFPADNPKLTMVVILDEPEGKRWGGTDAAPVFRRIAEQLMPNLVS